MEAGGGTSSFGALVPAGASFALGLTVTLPFASVWYGCQRGWKRAMRAAACGLGGRIHPQIAWAKLAALAEGAKLATRELRA